MPFKQRASFPAALASLETRGGQERGQSPVAVYLALHGFCREYLRPGILKAPVLPFLNKGIC